MTHSFDPCIHVKEADFNTFISFLAGHVIRVRDVSQLTAKLSRIRSHGPSKFQVVSDFDRTLTPQWLKDPCSKTGKPIACHSSHGVIESSPHLSAEYVKATRKLAEHYIPLEHDHRLGLEEKRKAMEDWYHDAHDCMLAEDVSEARLAQIVEHAWSTCAIHLRSKCAELFQLSLALNIPITVLSAGLSDVIEDILKLERIPIDDVSEVMVVGNRMIFNDSGKHVGFSEPVIHSLNKRDALSHALNHSEVRAERPYALLMGDLIGDVDFVHSIPNLEEYIAIGFLSDPWSDTPKNDIEDRIDAYLKHFDIVILNGAASMDVPLELLKVLFS